ncbi:MAG: hypothetical protein JXR31_10775 [Prolixibacteraceae bacterium]|nr:hypothetical protein [Prolixibacteraceae bacterium]MBN2774724.1 hypothetical protein [Prolixibacteraceae bacterium]
MKLFTGIFFILHGLIYLLYFAHSQRYFELKPGLLWPDGSWLFSKFIGEKSLRKLAGIFCILSAAGFILGGIFRLANLSLWEPVIIATSVFASLFFILLWDGKIQRLDDKGGISVVINSLIIILLLVFF